MSEESRLGIQLFERLESDFGNQADKIINTIIEMAGKERVTIPGYDYCHRKERNEKIIREFNGGNYRELALKFNLSQGTIRQIINNHRRAFQLSGQKLQ